MTSTTAASPRADAALVASVPIQAIGRNRVRQSAKRLLSLALLPLAATGLARTQPQQVKEFRGLCRTLLRRGTLPETDATRLQRYAAMIHDDLCRTDLRV